MRTMVSSEAEDFSTLDTNTKCVQSSKWIFKNINSFQGALLNILKF